MFLSALTNVKVMSAALLVAIPLSCISMNNQEINARPQIVNTNVDEPVFFRFSVKTSK